MLPKAHSPSCEPEHEPLSLDNAHSDVRPFPESVRLIADGTDIFQDELDRTPVPGADSWDTPFAGINNVTFADGVTAWTRDISHGELLRDGYDEKMILDPSNLQLLYQGRDPASGGNYSLLPYRLALLTLED